MYSHRAAKAVEFMICDALLAADPVLKISSAVDVPEEFGNLSDSIVKIIEYSKDPALQKSRDIIRRIRNRELYKMVGETLLPEGQRIKVQWL